MLAFLNTTLRLHQLNQVVVSATGYNCCDYTYDSSSAMNRSSGTGITPAFCSNLLENLEEFVIRDEKLESGGREDGIASSLLSGALSMALCFLQWFFLEYYYGLQINFNENMGHCQIVSTGQ